jgi:hypothetical protein
MCGQNSERRNNHKCVGSLRNAREILSTELPYLGHHAWDKDELPGTRR